MATRRKVTRIGTRPAAAKLAVALKERREALKQQAATARILKVIASSPSDVQPVFDAIVRSAVRLCGSLFGSVYRFDGEMLHFVAHHNFSPAALKILKGAYPKRADRSQGAGRAILTKSIVRIDDIFQDRDYRVAYGRKGGWRRVLAVPMMRDGAPLGTIAVSWADPGPIPDSQVELLKTFADQAVIAIENARLFNDTKSALARQTSTAEILRVLGGSMTDAQPVFDAIVKNCHELFKGAGVVLRLASNGLLEVKASSRYAPGPVPIDRTSAIGACVVDGRTLHFPDLDQAAKKFPRIRQLGLKYGYRSGIYAPLTHAGKAIGAIGVLRRDLGAFDEEDIQLLNTFADQAVIAIENVRLFNETKEALEQQTATSDVLGVISRSPTDLQPVFDAILKSATELCDAHLGVLNLYDGERARTVAQRGGSGEFARWVFDRGAFKPDGEVLLRVIAERQPVQAADIRQSVAYRERRPNASKFSDLSGARTFLAVPLLKDNTVVGNIGVYRPEVRPFTDKQIALVSTFANQAVIAIENVRLFNETKEALEQQTATAKILGVMSSSPTDVQPVLDAVAESAARLCETDDAVIRRVDPDGLRRVAHFGPLPAPAETEVHPLVAGSVGGRAVLERRAIHVEDMEEELRHGRYPEARVLAAAAGWYRSMLAMPLVREDTAIGVILIRRKEFRPFTDKQIALLKTFADQAVIAIENVRLFNETKEALEQQTATSQVLAVISSSPTDLRPVFDAILKSAMQLCDAHLGLLNLYDGERLRTVAQRGGSREFAKWVFERGAFKPDGGAVLQALTEGVPSQVADALLGPGYVERKPNVTKFVDLGGVRTFLAVPLVKDKKVVGNIGIYRPEVRPFTDKQIALVSMFANQAVIAIENARLFNETKEALEQQTATAEILKVIASSPTEVQPVFDVIVERAVRLCGARFGRVYRYDGSTIQMVASHGLSAKGLGQVQRVFPRPAADDTIVGRVILARRPYFMADIEHDEAVPPLSRQMIQALNTRSQVTIPMLRAGEPIGAITMGWDMPAAFDDQQVALLQTFADQAVIAIENVRLFNETKESLERQTATADILKVIASSPSDVQPVFNAIATSAKQLFGALSAVVTRVVGDKQHLAAFTTTGESGDETLQGLYPVRIGDLNSGRAIATRAPAIRTDTETDPSMPAAARANARTRGYRSVLAVPMLREGVAIGSISVSRAMPGPFSDHQIGLLQTFADQAVIAIENVRLFNETKEALERQTATAEILEVIASSPSDVQPVFDAIAASARRLLAGGAALVARRAGDKLELAAYTSTGETADAELRKLFPAPITGRGHLGKAILSAAPVGISDVQTDDTYSEAFRASARARGLRSIVSVPMLRDGEPIGVISVNRPFAGKFSEHQTNLLKTFADQAVIAIENVRLFKELQARTEALTKSVGQLTALGEVGQAISSTLDLETVLKTIVARAVQLTGLASGSIYEYDEQAEEYHLRAVENMSAEIVEVLRSSPIRRNEGPVWQAGLTGQPTEIPEMRDESYQTPRREFLLRAGFRALLVVPLMRENRIVGALSVTRKAPGAFAPEVVELLKTFATQSALAIQNARLFREIAEKGRQLEVASQHKSQFLASMSHELRTPLNALLGFNEMLLGDIYGEVPGDMRPPLAQMQSSGKHLLRLINNVLDLAKIEAGRMELALAEYSVHDTVESVRSTLQPLAADKGLDFRAAVPPDIPLAYGDPGRITQCLMNLAGNSLKFTKAGKVEISVAMDDGQLRYRVADTGIGIPPDKIDGLFTEFKQTDATVASEYGGTGLGLSISKKFVEMHGGRIWAESEPGRGSVFTFEVPLRAKAP